MYDLTGLFSLINLIYMGSNQSENKNNQEEMRCKSCGLWKIQNSVSDGETAVTVAEDYVEDQSTGKIKSCRIKISNTRVWKIVQWLRCLT